MYEVIVLNSKLFLAIPGDVSIDQTQAATGLICSVFNAVGPQWLEICDEYVTGNYAIIRRCDAMLESLEIDSPRHAFTQVKTFYDDG